jgi:type II secretion system protein D
VVLEPFPELGQIVIIGDPADVAEVEKIIAQITKLAATAETEIRIFELQYGDATAVANTLTQLYQRIIVGAGALTRAPVGQQLQQSSAIILALPRQNAILVGAPRGRLGDIEKTLRQLDQPLAQDTRFKTYPLRRANATRVATTIQQFYTQRFPGEAANQNLVRVQAEDRTNAVLVQASPQDQEEIARLINYMDTQTSSTINEIRIVPLRSAIAADLATIIQQAIAEAQGQTGAAQPGLPGQQLPGGFQQPGFQQQPLGGLGRPTTAEPKSATLRLVTPKPDGKEVEAGFLEDVRVIPDVRLNVLIVTAPPTSMEFVLTLIRQLDLPPTTRAFVKVFQLKRSDAASMQLLLYQLFFGTAGGVGAGGLGGFGGGGLGGFGGLGGLGGQLGQLQRTPLTGEAAPLVDLRIATDTRTNSIIVAGSETDILLVQAIVERLESADVRDRINRVYRLKNTNAQDVANALSLFLRTEITVLGLGELTPFTQIEREVVVVPELISNSLIISATPKYYEDVEALIRQLDEQPPQVVIQVMIAAVRLDNAEEFGVELGLQSPLLFQRSLVQGGVTVNNIPQVGAPGFPFNTLGPLPNSSLVSPAGVGTQGISNFSVGRQNANGLGGFVFSASSDAVNVLIRALKTQGRLEVLSRPQITALDNQVAFIQVGQQVPYISNSTIGVTGQIVNTVQQQQVGIILQVTPKISPDDHVIMRVEPQVSDLSTSTVNLGNNVFAPIFNITQASTTVSAMNGQTVAIGGLITRRDDKQERKVPWLGDLHFVGAAFRFRTQTKQRTELLILMTPHIVRSRADAERIKAIEAEKMNWTLGDLEAIHGSIGLEQHPPGVPGGHPGMPGMPGGPDCDLPTQGHQWPTTMPGEALPTPRTVPPPILVPDSRGPALPQPPPGRTVSPPIPAPDRSGPGLPLPPPGKVPMRPGPAQPEPAQPEPSTSRKLPFFQRVGGTRQEPPRW